MRRMRSVLTIQLPDGIARDQTYVKDNIMHYCEDCGLLLDNMIKLQRHVKTWRSNDRNRTCTYDIEGHIDHKPGFAYSEKYSDIESEESEYFAKLLKRAWLNDDDELEKKEKKYKKQGRLSLRDAEKMPMVR